MVLEIAADAGKMLHDRHAGAAKLPLVSYPRLHQELGRVDRAQRQHDFGMRSESYDLAIDDSLNTGCTPAVKDEPRHERASHDREIRPIEIRLNVGTEHVFPLAVLHPYIHEGGPARSLHHATVGVIKGRKAQGPQRLDHGRCDRIRVGRGLDIYESTDTAVPQSSMRR